MTKLTCRWCGKTITNKTDAIKINNLPPLYDHIKCNEKRWKSNNKLYGDENPQQKLS